MIVLFNFAGRGNPRGCLIEGIVRTTTITILPSTRFAPPTGYAGSGLLWNRVMNGDLILRVFDLYSYAGYVP
jgi:hypothetical protein